MLKESVGILAAAATSGGIAGIGREAGRVDAVNGAGFVLLGDVAADADSADDTAITAADEHATGHRDDATLGGVGQRRDEGRRRGGTAGEFATSEAHAQGAPGFALRNLRSHDAGAVLALEGEEVSAGIEYSDGERLQLQGPSMLKRLVDNSGGLREGEGSHGVSVSGGLIKHQPRAPLRCNAAISAGGRPHWASEATPRSPATSGGVGRPAGVRLKRGAGPGCTIPSSSTKLCRARL